MPGAERAAWSSRRRRAAASWRISLAAATLLFTATNLAAQTAQTGAAEDHFRDGLQALDEERWEEAEKSLRQAAKVMDGDGHPVLKWDKGRRRLNTRGWRESYLPLHFLGMALRAQGRCAEAVEVWDECERYGAIQETPQLHKELQRMRADCER